LSRRAQSRAVEPGEAIGMTYPRWFSRCAGLAVFALTTLLLAACGGGGGSNSDSGGTASTPPPVQGTISGTVIKGPVASATVSAYALVDGSPGARIATGTTDARGNFSLAMGTYAGSVMLQVMGGTYSDEASGNTMPMASGDVMTAVIPAMTAGSTLHGIAITPLTSMAQAMAQHMSGGMIDANISSANSAIGHYFMVTDIVHDMPIDVLTAGSGNSATQDAINHGMVLAGMSQLARVQGMASSSAMVTAMTSDAADGVMDGRMSGNAVMMGGMGMSMPMSAGMGTTGLAAAMNAFVASAQNRSGVAAATLQTLMSQLNGSDGRMMPGGSGALPDSTISGKAFNGSVTRATITAFAINGGTRGPQLASTTTDGQGAFTISLGSYAGPVMLQASNGSYLDEATGTTMTMAAADTMTAVLPGIGSGASVSGLWITPLTSMAQARAQAMSGGMIDANVNSANTAVGAYFMVGDVLHAMPMDPATPGAGAPATQDERNCGITIAAMSQYAKAAGMSSSAFVTAMTSDASDGMMNGRMGGTQITMGGMMGSGGMGSGGMMQPSAGTTGLATAMSDFMSSPMNHSGLTAADMNMLIQKLAASGGQL
jgi:hypothetical protein